jgi:hypothetical protein
MYFRMKLLSSALLLSLVSAPVYAQSESEAMTIHVQILDANTGHSIPNELVYVAFADKKYIPAYKADAKGIANVEVKASDRVWATTFWDACGARPLLSGFFPYIPIEKIVSDGLVLPNPCGHAKSDAVSGTVVIFAKKVSFWQSFMRGLRS